MIEKTVLKYLDEQLNGDQSSTPYPVYMEEPEIKTASYVVLRVIDRGRTDYIDAVTFNIRSYGASMLAAAELNELVKAAMYEITSIDNVSSSKCGGGGQALEVTTNRYAYECVFNLYYMED